MKLLLLEVEVIERVIKLLERKRENIRDEIKEQEVRKWRKRKNQGWKPLVFKTNYENSDGERGIIVDYYAIAPKVKKVEEEDLEDLEDLEDFIKKLERKDYYYFNDEYIFRAVWPEKYINDDDDE